MSFDAVTFSAVQALKLKVGEAMQVPLGYTNSKFIDSGAPFDPVQYPKLALASKPSFNGSNWEKVTIPPFKGSMGATRSFNIPATQYGASATTGTNSLGTVGSFTLGGEYFIVFNGRSVARTTGGDLSTMAYFTTLPDLGGTITAVSMANNQVYISYTTTTSVLVLSEKTLTTRSMITMPATGAWRFRSGGGSTVAFRMIAGNTILQSADGVNFSSVTTTATAANIINGVEYGAGVWVVATTGTSNNMHSSPDLVNWTARTAGAIGHQRLKWNGSAFVAVAATVGGAFWNSPDGITWTSRAQAQSALIMNELDSTTSGVFVASSGLSETTALQVQISTDNGNTWVSKTALTPYGTSQFSLSNTVRAFGNAIFYCGSWSAYSQIMFGFSNDNLATAPSSYPYEVMQTSVQSPVFKGQVGLLLENNTQVGSAALKGYITNPNFTSWTPMSIQAPVPMIWGNIFVTSTRFVVVARPLAVSASWTATGNYYIFTSTDGVNWTYATNATAVGTSVASVQIVNDRLMYIGTTLTTSWYSDDYGATAVAANYSSVGTGSVFAPGPGRVVAINYNSIYISTDGANMVATTGYPTTTAYTTQFAAMTSTLCIATALPGTAPFGITAHYVSYDGGYVWGLKNFPVNVTAGKVAIVDGWFVVQTSPVSFMSSRDANTWTLFNFPPDIAANWTFTGAYHGGASRYLAGVPTTTMGYFLRPNQSNYVTPAMTPTVPGMKWVVKAK